MKRTEEIEQARLVKWSHKVATREALPALRWLHHSPNGGKRDAVTGGQMKALGTKPGLPDLILPFATDCHVGLVIEMKSAIGRTTPEQDEWLEHFSKAGWDTYVCRSAEEARGAILEYFGLGEDECPPLA